MRPGYRALLAIGLLLATACQAPSAPTASAPAASTAAAPTAGSSTAAPETGQAAWQQEWDRVVAAAKQEGKVVAVVPPGPQYEPAIRESFGKAFPGIEV